MKTPASIQGIVAALLLVSLAVVVACILKDQVVENPGAQALMAALQKECDPDTLGSDYAFSTSAMPTETRRLALLEKSRAMGSEWLPTLKRYLVQGQDSEFTQMVRLAALAMGDQEQLLPVCRLLAWSDYPAVRICAARELRRLHDPRTAEWFEAALDDDRFVVNCACGDDLERFYPVRTVAMRALKELGQNVW